MRDERDDNRRRRPDGEGGGLTCGCGELPHSPVEAVVPLRSRGRFRRLAVGKEAGVMMGSERQNVWGVRVGRRVGECVDVRV